MTSEDAAVGLCRRCRWAQPSGNRRGSVFWLCRRSLTDATWDKYPRLPVLECRGFEQADGEDQEAEGS